MPRFRKSGYFEAFCGPDESKVPVCVSGGCDYVDDASLSLLAQQLSNQTLSASPTPLECPSTPSTLPALSRSSTVTSTTSTSSSRADSVAFGAVDYSATPSSTAPLFRQVDYSAASTASADFALSPLDRPPTPLLSPTCSGSSVTSSYGHCSVAPRRRNALSSPSTSPRLPARLLLLESTSRSRVPQQRRGATRITEATRDALRACWAEACCEQGQQGIDEDEESSMAVDQDSESVCRPRSSSPRWHSIPQHHQHQRARKVVGSECRGRPRRVATY